MSQDAAKAWAAFLAVVVVIGLGMVITGKSLPPPPDWLVGWTSWAVSAVTLILAPIAVMAAAKALNKWALKL